MSASAHPSASAALLPHYRWPAEWEPQQGVILTWPHDRTIWEEDHEAAEAAFDRLCRLIAEVERVELSVPEAHARRVERRLLAAGVPADRLGLHPIASDDIWARDHGPIAMVRRPDAPADLPPRLLLDWTFNAWGGKFPCAMDNALNAALAPRLGIPRVPVDFVLEGGAIEGNGAGDLLTTRAVLLRANRNGGPSLERVEAVLREHLRVERIHWLDEGLTGDDTDGHIDDVARFVAPDTIVYVAPEDSDHPDHAIMARNRELLEEARNGAGHPFHLVPLPAAPPVYVGGEPTPASYANFLIINERVLVPVFDDARDARALGVLGEHFPGREIVGIDSRVLIAQSGAVHCVSQQLPAAP